MFTKKVRPIWCLNEIITIYIDQLNRDHLMYIIPKDRKMIENFQVGILSHRFIDICFFVLILLSFCTLLYKLFYFYFIFSALVKQIHYIIAIFCTICNHCHFIIIFHFVFVFVLFDRFFLYIWIFSVLFGKCVQQHWKNMIISDARYTLKLVEI